MRDRHTDTAHLLRPFRALVVLALAGALLSPAQMAAQEQHEHEDHDHGHAEAADHAHEDGHGHGLHFSHPMVTESVSPDTKLRLDYSFLDFGGGGNESDALIEAEYAFHPSFSIEAILPYTFDDAAFGNAALVFKLANYAFEEAGVLLGYGLELEFPTNGEAHHADPTAATSGACAAGGTCLRGHRASVPRPSFHGTGGVGGTLGTETYTAAPFLNAGLQTGPWELVGFGVFEIPFNHAEQRHVSTALTYNLSALYEISPDVQALMELNGRGGISGEAADRNVLYATPGLKVRPFGDNLFAGLAVSLPVTSDRDFDTRLSASLFYHFF